MDPDRAVLGGVLAAGFAAAAALVVRLRRDRPLLAFRAPALPVPETDAALLLCAIVVGGCLLRGFWATGIGLLGVVVLLALHRVRLPRHFGPGALSVPGAVLGGLWLTAAATPFLLLGAGATQALLKAAGIPVPTEPAVALFRGAHGWRQLLPLLLAAVVLAPLAEEALFRGFLHPVLKRRWGGPGAWVATAFAFAACHFNLPTFPPLFLYGLILGLAYERTGGSLLLCISSHFWFNLLNAVLLMLGVDPSS